jgi:hypothetical protein
MNAFIKWLKSPFVADAGERAVKSAAQGLAVGGAFDLTGSVAFTDIDWSHGLNFAAGMFVASILTSLLSYKRGNQGTASMTSAVEVSE